MAGQSLGSPQGTGAMGIKIKVPSQSPDGCEGPMHPEPNSAKEDSPYRNQRWRVRPSPAECCCGCCSRRTRGLGCAPSRALDD